MQQEIETTPSAALELVMNALAVPDLSESNKTLLSKLTQTLHLHPKYLPSQEEKDALGASGISSQQIVEAFNLNLVQPQLNPDDPEHYA